MVQPAAGHAVPKRFRGRPKKPHLAPRLCGDGFDAVCNGVVELAAAKGGMWAAAKEAVRARADREKGFSAATLKVIGFLLQHINLEKGCDWHAAQTIAKELGVSIRTVERAFGEARLAGYILREERDDVSVKGTQSTKPWRTTVPMLLVVAEEIATKKSSEGHDRKFMRDPTGKSKGPDGKIERTRQKNQQGPDKKSWKNPTNMSGKYDKDEYEKGNTHTRAHARAQGGACDQFDDFLEELRQKGPDNRNVIDHLIAPLVATKTLPRVANPLAYVAELVGGIADKGYEAVVLDRGRIRAREERSTMPSLALFLRLLNEIASEIRIEQEGATATGRVTPEDANDGTLSEDTQTFHAQLASQVTAHRFHAWELYRLRVERVEDCKAIISFPNDGLRRMIVNEFPGQVEKAARAAFGAAHVEIAVRGPEPNTVGDFRVDANPTPPTPSARRTSGNPRGEAAEPRTAS